ncbi:MAG: ATP-binding protein [Burkholderiales bacterium]
MAATCVDAAPWGVTTIEQAEFVVSDSRTPPADTAAWQPIRLPDNWHVSRPGFNGQVWYRLAFSAASAQRTHVLYLPRNSAAEFEFFVNGKLLSISRPQGDPRVTELQRPLTYNLPIVMLRPADNAIHIRAAGNAEHRHGLPRVTVGFGLIVRPQYYESRYDLQVSSIAMFGAALLAAGLLALFVWRAQRNDRVLLWVGITSLAWACSAYLLVWPPRIEHPGVRQLLFFGMQYLYVVPLLVLCLRIGGARFHRLETALWILFVASCGAAAMLDFERYPALAEAASVTTLCLTVAFLAWLVRAGMQQRRWPLYVLGLALTMVVVFRSHDWARWMGYADFDSLLLAPFAMPFLIIALGATALERHFFVTRALERTNRELEQRITDKVHEVEHTYRKMQDVLHEQAVLRERQRIMADMHDGLGSSLVSLLSRLRSRSMDLPQIEQRLDDILTDLRAIVDSLQPVEGDLGVVLGNIRYRISRAIEDSGVRFIWQVEPLPALEHLTPETVLSIQRIILEALTNALRHAAASSVTVSAKRDRDAIVITVADDGAGFELSKAKQGHGLRNMRGRAQKLGIAIDICSSPAHGTCITLAIAAKQDVRPETAAIAAPRRETGAAATTGPA